MNNKLIFAVTAVLGSTAALAGGNLKDADTDGDGFISQAEFTASYNKGLAERFARVDSNADGLLSEEELGAVKKERHAGSHREEAHRKGHAMSLEKVVEHHDTDGDGSLSLAEMEAMRFSPDAQAFATADTNGSGTLDAAELKAMMDARRAAYRAARDGDAE
jgi:Ca2+-binding EF-hand superfamily protein